MGHTQGTFLIKRPVDLQVLWAREGSRLDPRRHVISEDVVMGTRHILTIRSVQQDDFDTYTCTAKNGLGSMKGRMIVTGAFTRVTVLFFKMTLTGY